MLEYLGALFGMHQADSIISTAQAEETPPAIVRQTKEPNPVYRVPRDQRIEAIRKRLAQQQKDDEKTPDPYQEMWDKDWINRP